MAGKPFAVVKMRNKKCVERNFKIDLRKVKQNTICFASEISGYPINSFKILYNENVKLAHITLNIMCWTKSNDCRLLADFSFTLIRRMSQRLAKRKQYLFKI